MAGFIFGAATLYGGVFVALHLFGGIFAYGMAISTSIILGIVAVVFISTEYRSFIVGYACGIIACFALWLWIVYPFAADLATFD